MTKDIPPIPATDPAERSRLRELVRQRDAMAGKDYVNDIELHIMVNKIDQRLRCAQESAARSNRAKGLVRELTTQREQLLQHVHQQRIEIHGVRVQGDDAEMRLLLGAPAELRAEIDHAENRLKDAQAQQARCTKATPLRDRVDADYRVHAAQTAIRNAVQAALDWGCDETAATS
jgi:hypothetical protein